MYAGTIVNWHEVLADTASTTVMDPTTPLFLCVFSSDKGPEKITVTDYSRFIKLYGTPSFEKYGQPSLQAFNILKAGGRIIGKRLVSESATLSNLIVVANLTTTTENKVDSNGKQLYIGPDGNETTDVTDTPATITKLAIKYELENKKEAKTESDVEAYVQTLQTDNKFPLFVICDNGRGKSIKKIKISADYNSSRSLQVPIYLLSVYENTTSQERISFSTKPRISVVKNNKNYSLELVKSSSNQVRAFTYRTGFNAFIEKVAELSGYSVDDLYELDLLFAKSFKEVNLTTISVDSTGINLDSQYGINIISDENANGDFGDAPFPGETWTEPWAKEAVKFFDGTFSDAIYDVEQYKVDFCVDANYPHTPAKKETDVKSAISNLANEREDFFFFRDMGLNINSINDVLDVVNSTEWIQSPFVADYISTYDIIDPLTSQQIKVTMCHGLAPLLVSYYVNNLSSPVAGQFNGFIITEAIDDTLNIIPRITPKYNYKQVLEDTGVNFINYDANGYLALQSLYTTQDHMGPLKYINNVLITQRVIKAIREYCPSIRFMIMDNSADGFSKYKSLIEDNVIENYKKYFSSISLKYTASSDMVNSKVFNGSLECYYYDFVQGEVFDVFAIESGANISSSES